MSAMLYKNIEADDLYLANFFVNLWSCSTILLRYFSCLNSHSSDNKPSSLSSLIAEE